MNIFKSIQIGQDRDYLQRWYIIPRNRFFNIYLHRYTGSDDDRALHDHPWWSLSINGKGRLAEIRERFVENDYGWWQAGEETRDIIPFWPYLRAPLDMHRMLLRTETAWTLFITGPRVRDWGFRQFDEPNNWLEKGEFFKKYGIVDPLEEKSI